MLREAGDRLGGDRRWLLAPEGGGTRVTLVHSGFIRTVDFSDYPFGWGHFMSEMARVAVSLSSG